VSAVFRLMDTVIGRKCEVEECVCVAEENDLHCYDHSVMRLIEPLFEHFDEQCSFGGINCTGTATHMNEHEVSMCENCYNVYRRTSIYDGGSYHRNINWRALMDSAQEEGDETE
jgi:hypothetical protein